VKLEIYRESEQEAFAVACGACGLEILLEEPFQPFGLRVGGWGFGQTFLILDPRANELYSNAKEVFEIELKFELREEEEFASHINGF
jgi:hypothetical protein